jgi:Flp pilus assembly protein TadB
MPETSAPAFAISGAVMRARKRERAMHARAGAELDKWMWLCPALAVVLAAAVFALFGLSVWSALLAALLLVCPALLLWAVNERRAPRHDRLAPGEQP